MTRTIGLQKLGHTYVFRFDNVEKLFIALMELVNDETQDFTWYDADVLRYSLEAGKT